MIGTGYIYNFYLLANYIQLWLLIYLIDGSFFFPWNYRYFIYKFSRIKIKKQNLWKKGKNKMKKIIEMKVDNFRKEIRLNWKNMY